jgi:hypothetical protein
MSNTSPTDSYEYWRERWVHEDELINQRLSWLLASQTLLFAAYGLALQVGANPSNTSEVSKKTTEVLSLIPYIGFYSSVSIMVSVLAAVIALYFLWKRSGNFKRYLPVTVPTTIMGVAAGVSLPLIFIIAWFSLSK